MSVDNVIAIAGAAQQADPDHQIGLVIFGLLVSIPLIVWGSTLVLRLLERYPIVITLGGALLGWIAGGMMMTDVVTVEPIGGEPAAALRYVASMAGALLVVVLGKALGGAAQAMSSPGRLHLGAAPASPAVAQAMQRRGAGAPSDPAERPFMK